MFFKSFRRQILYVEGPDGLRITIRPRRQELFVYIFFVVWLCGWTWAGIKGLTHILDNPPARVPTWPLGWVIGEVIMIGLFLSMPGGGETIWITPDFVKCRKQLFGIGLTHDYFLHEILNLRYQLPYGRRPGGLAFDYEGRTVRFVSDVTSTEAVELLGKIRERMRDYGAMETAEKEG
jgi:hypothetical protein